MRNEDVGYDSDLDLDDDDPDNLPIPERLSIVEDELPIENEERATAIDDDPFTGDSE